MRVLDHFGAPPDPHPHPHTPHPQALGDQGQMAFMRGQRSLEINPRHPLIKALLVRACFFGGGGGVVRVQMYVGASRYM